MSYIINNSILRYDKIFLQNSLFCVHFNLFFSFYFPSYILFPLTSLVSLPNEALVVIMIIFFTGLCGLSCTCKTWWTEEACS